MKLLLINPRFPESFWSFKWAIDKVMPANRRTMNSPLGLATLAALCPDDWEIEVVDENIETIPLDPEADLIGICGMGIQFERQKELMKFYRNKGHFVVAGGSYASLCPEAYEHLADTVIAGEAEYIWPAFCRDFAKGVHNPLYQESDEVSLHDSPIPRFDLLKMDRYHAVSLQFSRGCPYRCEFCDIIIMFGRKPRTKAVEQVGRELDALREQGVRNVFFVDDNLIGNKKLAKELLVYLADYQKKHSYYFHFGTEASLNLAGDDELLEDFVAANFEWVFIGIESPDEDSLKETMKFQNTRMDMMTSVRKIYSYGIEITAGFIVGFDHDTPEIFEKQFQFIMNSGIQAAMIGLLTAIPKTPLYERLEKDGRLRTEEDDSDTTNNTKLRTNVMPLGMTYEEMVSGYRNLFDRLLENRNIAGRVLNKNRYLKNPIYRSRFSFWENVNALRKFIFRGILPGGFSRLYHFIRSIPWSNPRVAPMAIQDWIVGLAMRDFVERNLIEQFEQADQLASSYLTTIEKTLQRYLHGGALEVSFNQMKNTAANLSISMNGLLDRDFFVNLAPHLESVLKNTTSSITLNIEEFNEPQLQHLHDLLEKLEAYGDRVYIALNENLRDMIRIDSSVFNLVLDRGSLVLAQGE
ncbi:MAG: radical SAM protein [Gemmatimonadota bacterium]|nr:radical SAM protein [Gemmatimonadota bacterium]